MKRMWLAVIWLPAAGCSVGPDYHAPKIDAPSAFAATTRPSAAQPAMTQPATRVTPVDLARWWESFGDPKLNDLIGRALASNLDVRLAQARVREARAVLEYNTGALFPTVDAAGAYSRSRESQNAIAIGPIGAGSSSGAGGTTGTGGTGGTGGGSGGTTGGGTSNTSGSGSIPFAFTSATTNLYEAGFDANWEIDVFGGTRRAIESAQYSLEAQIEARRNALVTLLAEVARDYVTLRGLQHELAIVQNNVNAQQDTLNLTRSKFQAGIANDLDVAQSEALVAATQSEIPTLQTEIQQAIHGLGVLLDRPPAALERELSEPTAPVTGPPAVPPGLPADLLRRRPDVRQAERQLAASTANIGVAVADLFPKFSLTGSLGLESLSLKTFANSNSEFWSFGPTVTWRIFDAGQIRANIRVQNAREQEAMIQYRQAVLQSLSDVEDALVAYDQEQARRQALQRAVQANLRAVDLAKQLNTAGVVDFLNVLTAQQSLFQSQDQLAQSEQTVSTDLIALYKALGGGWETTDRAAAENADRRDQGEKHDSLSFKS